LLAVKFPEEIGLAFGDQGVNFVGGCGIVKWLVLGK
jgi:hypothetical protein